MNTNNNNAPFGVLKGIVHSDQDFARLAGSAVTGSVGVFEYTVVAVINGEYVIILPPGLASVRGRQAGYVDRVVTSVEVPVSMTETPFVELNLALAIIEGGDGDGDGLPDEYEIANGLDPSNPADAAPISTATALPAWRSSPGAPTRGTRTATTTGLVMVRRLAPAAIPS